MELVSFYGRAPVRVEGARLAIDGLEDFEFFICNSVSQDGCQIYDDKFSVIEKSTGAFIVENIKGAPEIAAERAKARVATIGVATAKRKLTELRSFVKVR